MSENSKLKLLRVSTLEIDETIQQLQTAFSDGRLNEEDFDDRMERALKAKTRNELLLLTEDLAKEAIKIVDKNLQPRRLPGRSTIAIFSGIEQKGQFLLPQTYRVIAIMGGCVLDLSCAEFASQITEIYVTAVMGGIQIIVPPGVRVEVHGRPILGGFSQNLGSENLAKSAHIIHIRGTAIMGGVEICTKKPERF